MTKNKDIEKNMYSPLYIKDGHKSPVTLLFPLHLHFHFGMKSEALMPIIAFVFRLAEDLVMVLDNKNSHKADYKKVSTRSNLKSNWRINVAKRFSEKKKLWHPIFQQKNPSIQNFLLPVDELTRCRNSSN